MTTQAELASQALLTLATNAYAWANTPTRRLKLWADVPPSLRPALFQFEGGKDEYVWSSQTQLKRAIEIKWFVYVAATDAQPGAPQIRAILEALDAAMRPSLADFNTGLNTLGGLVFSTRIKGVPLKEPGDLDGDGLAIIEVEIVLP